METIDEILEEARSTLRPRQFSFFKKWLQLENGTQAYMLVYGTTNYNSARTLASQLLANPNMKKLVDRVTALVHFETIRQIVDAEIDYRSETISRINSAIDAMERAREALEEESDPDEINKLQALYKAPAYTQLLDLRAKLLGLHNAQQAEPTADVERAMKQIIGGTAPK